MVKRYKTDAHEARRKNVIDMGLTFSAMIRLFSSGSKEKIITILSQTLNELPSIESKSAYSELHKKFCESFSKEINTALKVLKNGKKKDSKPASFGQAAKVLDIVAKVYVHYSNLPSIDVANKVKPFLNGPIDNPIMDYLKERYKDVIINAETIESIDEKQYLDLQGLVGKDIEARFGNEILPVEFDDIVWREKNR